MVCGGLSHTVPRPRPRTMSKLYRTALLFVLGTLSCSEPNDETSLSVGFAEPYSFSVVPWVFDAAGNTYLLDTGTPRSRILPRVFSLGETTLSEQMRPDLGIRGFSSAQQPLLVSSQMPAAITAAVQAEELTTFAGILGADILAQTRFAIDPRTRSLLFGTAIDSAQGIGAGVDLDVRLAGGGRTCIADGACFDFGPSRILFDVRINGIAATALLDTASTFTTLAPGLATRVERAGPTRIVEFERVVGDEVFSGRLGDVAQIEFGTGHVFENVTVIVADDLLDTAMTRLHVETGERVEVLLGQSVLESYLAQIDIAAPSVRLYPYSPLGPRLARTPTHFGFAARRAGECATVTYLVRDTPVAIEGLEILDCITRFDGVLIEDVQAPSQGDPGRGIGDVVVIVVDRDGVEFEFEAVYDDYESLAGQ